MMQPELPMKDITPKAKKAAPASKKPVTVTAKVSTDVAVPKPKPEPQQPKNVLAIIADAAANPALNPQVMRELLDMQKEIIAEERKQAFDTAFIALQAELPVINKDGGIVIPGRKTTPYATFDGIMEAIQPLLTKYAFGLAFETRLDGEKLVVVGRLSGHGHERRTEFPLPAETSGTKNPVQGWGSSLSYGRRYATVSLLNIRSRAIEDSDTDGHPGDFKRAKGGTLAQAPPKKETLTDAEAIAMRELIDWCGFSVPAFCKHYAIGKVADLPRELYAAAEKSCQDYHANQQAKNKNG